MTKMLKHIWYKIFNSSFQSDVQRHFYIIYFGGLISQSIAVEFRQFTSYLKKLNVYLLKHQEEYIKNMRTQSFVELNSLKSCMDVEMKRFRRNELYYSLFQILIDMIVYKAQSLVNNEEESIKFVNFVKNNLNLKELIFCQLLNPLYYCDPIVILRKFGLNFVDCGKLCEVDI